MQIKQLYMQMPKQKDELYSYEIDWESLFDHELIQSVCRPWIAKKINEYMGEEEPLMINIVIKLLMQKCTSEQLFNKMQNIMDDACDEFVEKLWRVIVFEDIKIKAEMYPKIEPHKIAQ
jgi:hypothetical protein